MGLNFLIIGANGGLTDTIIYAHVDVAKQQVTLISIPRDLYINNRKINAIYHSFGMNELMRQLTSITGYKIDKYIFIDMYAFVDVIDAIGGVDITLDKTVVDPTYKVYDDGKWGTLYYPPGTYHFNGRQALRLARTRHTTSDFERAKRQHLVLDSLRKKALSLQVGDADKILKIAQIVLANTQTDITPQEAIMYFFRFRNFDVRKDNVLSTANILESYNKNDELQKTMFSECNLMEEGEDKTKCLEEANKMDKGEYLLKPEGDNWNLIKWFFRNAFEET
jgi:polyisoprenyl-teichoic acid--peptidoglycan teichoic acid transferase